jgi:hypothetical protein
LLRRLFRAAVFVVAVAAVFKSAATAGRPTWWSLPVLYLPVCAYMILHSISALLLAVVFIQQPYYLMNQM